ncbi:MAG: 3-methyl-2-oxobutanoate dehydrogenase subunit VorB [Spirochaetes bacterium]|nr:3-methyl-2-oxobutanoate dehydrogenase subunit VorB [Spirochaetota bacterium]
MKKQLMKGNEAVIYGAIYGGSTHFFGYPITPASEVAHTAALLYTKTGRHFLQAECEVNAINMVYGAAGAGVRVMTASSGPGIALMSEGISYIAGSELPAVVVDVQRAGPGLGNIWPEQSDYNMVVKGGGHGNYKNVVFAPNSAQEMCDFTYKAFQIADKYRVLVFILTDAYIGQMMEPVALPEKPIEAPRHDWALYADKESRKNLITSIFMSPTSQQGHNIHLQEKYAKIEKDVLDYEEIMMDDADLVYVAYGISARVCLTAVRALRVQGKKVGMLRLKTLFPFPNNKLKDLAAQNKTISVVELSNGQMANDVDLAVNGKTTVHRYLWMGGVVPSTEELVARTLKDL